MRALDLLLPYRLGVIPQALLMVFNAWATGPTLAASYQSRGGCATSCDNALIWGGSNVAESSVDNPTQSSNGTAWSNGGNLVAARFSCPGAGSPTAAATLAGNGSAGFYTKGDTYNGTAWTAQGTITGNRRSAAAIGVASTACATVGGFNSPSYLTTTQKFDGSVFAAGGALATGTENIAGAGSDTAGIAVGGDTAADSFVATAQTYNGTSWSTITALPVATRGGAMSGASSSAAMYFCGFAGGSYLTTNTGWNGSAWATLKETITRRYLTTGGGTSATAFVAAGQANDGSLLASSEQYR